MYPFQPWAPLWYLKVGQIAVDYSVTLLFALFLLLLAISSKSGTQKPGISRALVRRFSAISLIIYSILLPIQLFSYGLHWLNTRQQTQQVIRKASSDLSSLRERINASNSTAQLLTVLERTPFVAPTTSSLTELADQKKEVIANLDFSLSQLRASLQQRRKQDLIALFISTLKGVLGAAIIAFTFSRVNRILKPI